MFTGIVQAVGKVRAITATTAGSRLVVELGALRNQSFKLGDSIAVNGACLTVVDLADGAFAADVSAETLRVTTLGSLAGGSPVNLEPALTLAEPLGGHLVTGHVDGIGGVAECRAAGGTAILRVELPAALQRYVARKGSIAVDGVSLTVNDIDGALALVTLVPHTLSHTIMQHYRTGTRVNIEVDLVARYVERLLAPQ